MARANSTKETLKTYFLPPERASEAQVVQQMKLFAEQTLLNDFISGLQDILIVLNPERQIVYANSALIDLMGERQIEKICGLRLGEAVHCVHSNEMQAGCGTSKFCEYCGAARAILNTQQNGKDIQECRILRTNGEALELRVKTRMIKIEGQEFILVNAVDISHEKRRRALERVFFHDILNTAGGLKGFSQLLLSANANDLEEIKTTINNLSELMIEEINAQRVLLAAENGELETYFDRVSSADVLERVAQVYRWHPVGTGIEVRIDPAGEDFFIETDRALLVRVISNLTKNALEASKIGEFVTLGAKRDGEIAIFSVQNSGEMPHEVQMQIFNRSFSTKGIGRGLGTYSVKLLTERYLDGKVDYITGPETGTVFRISFIFTDTVSTHHSVETMP